jgi:ankyrin repeat protein
MTGGILGWVRIHFPPKGSAENRAQIEQDRRRKRHMAEIRRLTSKLRHDDPAVRKVALERLGALGDAATIDNVSVCLADKIDFVRMEAVRILSLLGGRTVVERMLPLLHDNNRHVRESVAESLGRIGGDALNILLEGLDNPDGEFRALMVKGLAVGGRDSVTLLISSFENPATRNATIKLIAEILGSIGSPEACDALAAGLKSPWSAVSESACDALLGRNDTRCLAFLLPRLKSPDSAVRKSVAGKLTNFDKSAMTQDELAQYDSGLKWKEKADLAPQHLLTAAKLGDINSIKLALEDGAPLDTAETSSRDMSGLGFHPAVAGFLSAIQVTRTALELTLTNGHTDAARFLIGAGARLSTSPHGPPGSPWNEYLKTAASNGNKPLAELALEMGAEVNCRGFHSTTPLMLAAMEGHAQLVNMLLERGADPFRYSTHPMNPNMPGHTARMMAEGEGYPEVAKILEEAENLPTGIVAEYDPGFGHTLFLRGDGPGLNWKKGIPMLSAGAGRWELFIARVPQPFEYKLLIDDSIWAENANSVAARGKTNVCRPRFPG